MSRRRHGAGERVAVSSGHQHWLSTSAENSGAQRAVAGSLKDDPDLVSMVEEIYRRGRPITEDGSYNLLHGLESGSGTK
ncbi:MAG: hypothetical protein U0736_12265 [Gemmataceae bacterium]